MANIPDLLTMLKAGVHFGHQHSKRHPRMEQYIFTSKSGFHIIDLEQTQVLLKTALEFVTTLVSNGGTILFLGTKKQAQPIIKKYAQDCGMPYITERWLGGTFTNFKEISRVLKRLTELKNKKSAGELDKYTKKEKLKFDREIEKLERMVGGIESLDKVPDAIFICDVKKEKTAVAEAIKKNIPIVAMCDTNVNPDRITYCIPANDDAVKSIDLITSLVAETVKQATEKKTQKQEIEKVKTEKTTIND